MKLNYKKIPKTYLIKSLRRLCAKKPKAYLEFLNCLADIIYDKTVIAYDQRYYSSDNFIKADSREQVDKLERILLLIDNEIADTNKKLTAQLEKARAEYIEKLMIIFENKE